MIQKKICLCLSFVCQRKIFCKIFDLFDAKQWYKNKHWYKKRSLFAEWAIQNNSDALAAIHNK